VLNTSTKYSTRSNRLDFFRGSYLFDRTRTEFNASSHYVTDEYRWTFGVRQWFGQHNWLSASYVPESEEWRTQAFIQWNDKLSSLAGYESRNERGFIDLSYRVNHNILAYTSIERKGGEYTSTTGLRFNLVTGHKYRKRTRRVKKEVQWLD